MKRTISLIVLFAFASVLASCNQFGQDEQKRTEEIAAKAAEMIAEQQKKAAEEKAKLEQQVQDEVQKQMAQKEAELKAAADAQAAAQKTPAKSSTKTTTVVVNPYQKYFQKCMVSNGGRKRAYCECYADQIARNLKPGASRATQRNMESAAILVCRLRK